jgi:hypothetical protein
MGGCCGTQLAAVFPGDLPTGSHLNACRWCSIGNILWIMIFLQVGIAISEGLINSLVQILLFNTFLYVLIAACPSDCVRFSSFRGVNCILSGGQNKFRQFNKAGAV